MSDFKLRKLLAMGTALAAGMTISIGVAHAVTDQAALAKVTAEVAACGKLPLSERGICKAEAVANYDQYAAKPAISDAERSARLSTQAKSYQERSIGEREAMDKEMRRYQAALAKCARLPLSERGICKSEAGTPEVLVSPTEG